MSRQIQKKILRARVAKNDKMRLNSPSRDPPTTTMTKRKRDRDPQPTIQRSPKATAPKQRVYHSGRQVTVYDAVANRASYEGFVKSTLRKNAFGERHRRSQTAYPADEVLGRRKHAPEEPIPFGGGEGTTGLPDSDLLIAVHQYASDFYAANGMGPVSYRTLDETALLAVGMLLEETARSCLGDNGDLVFIEPEDESEEDKAEERLQKKPPRKKSKSGKGVRRAEKEHGDGEDE